MLFHVLKKKKGKWLKAQLTKKRSNDLDKVTTKVKISYRISDFFF